MYQEPFIWTFLLVAFDRVINDCLGGLKYSVTSNSTQHALQKVDTRMNVRRAKRLAAILAHFFAFTDRDCIASVVKNVAIEHLTRHKSLSCFTIFKALMQTL